MPRSTTTHPPRPDASMVLLDEVMHRPLDPGYAEAAARRAAGTEPRRGVVSKVVITALAVGLGVVTSTAAADLRAPAPEVLSARVLLEEEIMQRQATADALADQLEALDVEIETLQSAALSGTFPTLLANTRRDAAAAGTIAVTGPGVELVVADAVEVPGADDVRASRVQDYDLQVVVNALWASGAEAITINGTRLTTTSAIRSAGDAILVGLTGLASPYTIAAIGDPQALTVGFARSVGQQQLSLLGSRYAISSSMREVDRIDARAGRATELFHARPTEAAALDGAAQTVGSQSTMPGTPESGLAASQVLKEEHR